MTIVESIKEILRNHPEGLTCQQVFHEIVENGLYSFGAKDPVSVVRAKLRNHCAGLDFPSASPVKHFKIVYRESSVNYYGLIDSSSEQVVQPELCTVEMLPEEKLQLAHQEHTAEIRIQVYAAILNNHPSFFERMVVDLLLKMGYGYDQSSGIVVGGPHDGGIDGIINEDKLGLDLIYLQAKRYSPDNKVGRKELQAFVGAMERIQKGVFITTSSFTSEAIKYSESQQQKSIKLIDGELLAELIVRFGVGVTTIANYPVYRIDSEYFESN